VLVKEQYEQFPPNSLKNFKGKQSYNILVINQNNIFIESFRLKQEILHLFNQ